MHFSHKRKKKRRERTKYIFLVTFLSFYINGFGIAQMYLFFYFVLVLLNNVSQHSPIYRHTKQTVLSQLMLYVCTYMCWLGKIVFSHLCRPHLTLGFPLWCFAIYFCVSFELSKWLDAGVDDRCTSDILSPSPCTAAHLHLHLSTYKVDFFLQWQCVFFALHSHKVAKLSVLVSYSQVRFVRLWRKGYSHGLLFVLILQFERLR